MITPLTTRLTVPVGDGVSGLFLIFIAVKVQIIVRILDKQNFYRHLLIFLILILQLLEHFQT